MTSITLAWRGPRIRIKVDGKRKGKWKKVWGWHVGMGFEALEEVWIGDSFEGGGLDVVGQEEARRHVSAAFQVEMRKWRREREFPRVVLLEAESGVIKFRGDAERYRAL